MISYSSQNKYRKRVKTEINEENLNIDYRKIITSFCGTPQNNQKT